MAAERAEAPGLLQPSTAALRRACPLGRSGPFSLPSSFSFLARSPIALATGEIMEEPHRVTAEAMEAAGGENGDLSGRGATAASERRDREGDFHGISVPVHDSPYRPGVRPKVPTAPAGYGGGAAAGGSGIRALAADSPRRGYERSPSAAGPQTFGSKYMPFAAGFSHQAGEAAVYRSSRLHAINPTAAVNEDTSYLYTLDSGKETPATRAANPHHGAEHVRNTAAAASAKGGFMGKVFSPIR